MKKILLVLLSLIIISGCASIGPVKTLDVKDKEAIAVGKLKVFYNGEDITSKTTILFNEIMWGTYSCKADESGFIALRLPIGKNYIARIAFGNFHYNVPKEYATFEIENNKSITYIGDIEINWTGPKDKSNIGFMFGAIGGLAEGLSSDGKIQISIIENLEGIRPEFKNKYNTERDILVSHIKVNESK